jgi:hypothetical protein
MQISPIPDQIEGCSQKAEFDLKTRWRFAMKHKPKSVPELKAMLDTVIGTESLLLQIRRFQSLDASEVSQ